MTGARVRRFLGLMSGTSLDGVDGVLLDVDPRKGSFVTVAHRSAPFEPDLREALLALAEARPPVGAGSELEAAARAARRLAHAYAEVVAALRDAEPGHPIEAIGAHGQTVRHRPEEGFSIQLLDAALLAELTCLPVAYDFRAADLAAGGEGAPLVPAFHASVFGVPGQRRAIVNVGGIANLTICAPAHGEHAGSGGAAQASTGFDTGPGNTLLDAWCHQHCGQPYDADGRWAGSGRIDPRLLARMLSDPYFARTAPKSTGRERFNLEWLRRHLAEPGPAAFDPADVQATLLELTTATIADAVLGARADAVYLCGGGARNSALVRSLAARLAPHPVRTTDALGIDPQHIEAAAFAWLAWRRVDALPGNVPGVTGAAGPRILGALQLGPATPPG